MQCAQTLSKVNPHTFNHSIGLIILKPYGWTKVIREVYYWQKCFIEVYPKTSFKRTVGAIRMTQMIQKLSSTEINVVSRANQENI